MYIKVKTSELEGSALDWAVAKCEGIGLGPRGFVVYYHEGVPAMWQPSTDWAQAGPIIERERISITTVPPSMGSGWDAKKPAASPVGYMTISHGASPLIAAMRCYVASKLGETVEIPEELM